MAGMQSSRPSDWIPAIYTYVLLSFGISDSQPQYITQNSLFAVSRVALLELDLLGLGLAAQEDAADHRHESEQDEGDRDRPGEEDEGGPFRHHEGLREGGLHELGEHSRQHHGRNRELELAHEVADHPEEEADPEVEERVPQAVGPDQGEDRDHRRRSHSRRPSRRQARVPGDTTEEKKYNFLNSFV